MSSSVGMMTFPIYGKIQNVPNHQPVIDGMSWVSLSLSNIYDDISWVYDNNTARPYGLPARLEWSSNIILRHAQKPAQGQVGIYQTTNPKP